MKWRLTGDVLIATLMIILLSIYSQSAEDIVPGDVYHCESLEDVNQAKEAGISIFEFRNRFWVRVGTNYKGPFRYLRSARKLLNQQTIEKSNSAGAGKPATPAQQQAGPFYNPQLILFPFIEYAPPNKTLFYLPGGQTVETAKIMIHPEPLEFNDIAFGVIDFSFFLQKGMSKYPGTDSSASARPGTPAPLQAKIPLEKQFAVTGRIAARETVTMPSAALTYWVGAAVLAKDSSILWRQYGKVEDDHTFKCLGRIPSQKTSPEFLLLFTLAQGKLKTNIRPIPNFPEIDATPYEYHILCSSTFDMGPNWFPPLQAATKKEYQKLLQSLKARKKSALTDKQQPLPDQPKP